jgi:hypothetical protein
MLRPGGCSYYVPVLLFLASKIVIPKDLQALRLKNRSNLPTLDEAASSCRLISSRRDPDPNPIYKFLGLPNPHPDPLVTSTNPNPDPSLFSQNKILEKFLA